MTTMQCPVCSSEVEFKIKHEPTDIPGVLREFIQCPKCPYTKNIRFTTKEIIDLNKEYNKLCNRIIELELNDFEEHSTIWTRRNEVAYKIRLLNKELAETLDEQS